MSIGVLRALQVGDLLCAVPALRSLRRGFPEACITLFGLPWAERFVARFGHYLDAFVPVPGFPGLVEQRPDDAAAAQFLHRMRAQRFDLVIQMHGNGTVTNGIVAQMGARRIAGFCDGELNSRARFMRYPENGHEIRRLVNLARFLGAPHAGEHLEFPLCADDEEELECVPLLRSLKKGRYLCLHAGARDPAKRWPIRQFARLADALAEEFRFTVVLTGSVEERPITAAIRAAMRSSAIDAAAPISLGALAALVGHARLLVTNDTSVSHIAAALRVPSVVIFRASEIDRWAPLDRHLHASVWDPAGTQGPEVRAQCRAKLRGGAPA